MGLILGLDLGVSSVGFGIIEEDTYNIVDYGVRLFDEADANNNLKRRTMRGARRLKSRKRNRIQALKYYLCQIGLVNTIDFEKLNNVYELRVKGLNEKLSSLELVNVLVNIAKHRGVAYDIAIDEKDKEAEALSSALSLNTKSLSNQQKYVCEIQFDKLKNGEKLRTTNNLYKSCDYEKELRKILSNQDLKPEDIEKIVDIIFRKREFSEGPGSEKFPTPYGSYRWIDNVLQHVNLIEVMRGKCSIFPEESRIAKCCYQACLFNLLNDLNNLTILKNGEKVKLTKEEKQNVIDVINEKGHITPKQLMKKLGVDEEHISGFRVDKNNKPLLTTFDIYEKMLKLELNSDFINDKNEIDQVIEVLTKTIVVGKRMEELSNLDIKLSKEEIEKLSTLTKVNGYHSLSKKAMDILIPELLSSNFNQMELIHNNNLFQNKLDFSTKNIPFDDSSILSPVAVRVHKQTLLIVNKLREEYGEFAAIVIETTRAKNSQEEKREEIEKQKKFEDAKTITNEFLFKKGLNPEKVNTNTKLKLRLYNEQNGKTIYSGETIDLDLLLNDDKAYEIEHIIPFSISFDNSLNNKALASHQENQDKGNHSPWGYFSSGKVEGPNDSWEKYVAFVNVLNLNPKKKENLLRQEDITKYENRKSFINRNLNDTSYGIRTVMNTLKSYFKANQISTNVFTIKGKITSAFRGRVGLKKDRDEYIHHAIDALIIASFKNQKTFYEAFELGTTEQGDLYHLQTGELFDLENPLEDSKLLKFISNLKNIHGIPNDFSYKVDTKTNRQFSDETIYSTRKYEDGEYVIKKYKDIYGKDDGEKVKKLFEKNEATKLLVYRNDKQTFELLEKIVNAYSNEKNPFAKYKEEHGYIRKYSKKGDGPIIKQLKYVDGKLGNYLDITQKYPKTNDKKVVLLQNTPYRTDFYISKEGFYKFLTIRRFHIKQIDGLNVIDYDLYQSLKENKKITLDDEYLFTLNRNNIIHIVGEKDEYFKFIATNNDIKNIIEVKRIERLTEKQMMVSIGKKVKKIEKYNVSPIGKYQKVVKETLKLVWK